MEFSFVEKMATVKIIIEVMMADGIIHRGEMRFLEQLKKSIGFDIPTVEDAEDLPIESAFATLNKMGQLKKNILVNMLQEVAEVDGYVHEKERFLILETIKNINLSEDEVNSQKEA